jgi:hypothetical protein
VNVISQIRPSAILDIIHSGEHLTVSSDVKARLPTRGACVKCGYVSSMETCKACLLLEGLNRGLPKLGVGKSAKTLKQYERIKIEAAKENDAAGAVDHQKETNDSLVALKSGQSLDF